MRCNGAGLARFHEWIVNTPGPLIAVVRGAGPVIDRGDCLNSGAYACPQYDIRGYNFAHPGAAPGADRSTSVAASATRTSSLLPLPTIRPAQRLPGSRRDCKTLRLPASCDRLSAWIRGGPGLQPAANKAMVRSGGLGQFEIQRPPSPLAHRGRYTGLALIGIKL
ncbi:hypothetical protein Pan14r_49490 [Crateriforma conspicua]|uniref:Uncharacterized protein n=1 Tax=Crateriforma conspicua TaxID=2527996 RepID=A0A5C5YCG7_9PLAN|nr:hypothetical protein Pan14r_49490 [Crateriforma conspicua]